MKNVTIISEDRVGLLADISYVLGKSNINIEALTVEVLGGKAVIAMEVKDPKRAYDLLSVSGFTPTNLESLVIKVPNENLEAVTHLLEGEKVKVLALDKLTSNEKESVLAINVDKPRKASKMLDSYILKNLP